jgi:hypothetical protein
MSFATDAPSHPSGTPKHKPPRCRSAPPKRAVAHLQGLCRAGLPPEAFVPALLEALHDVMDSDRNLFDWTDEDGQLLRYFVEGPIDPAVARLYFDEFHNRGEAAACMPAFASLRDSAAGVRGARELATRPFYDSALYNEIWRPQGLHTRIEGVVRNGRGKLLGSLVLYRGPHDAMFDTADEQLLSALLPSIARGLEPEDTPARAAGAANDEIFVAGPEPAETLMLDPQGRLLHASAGAMRLLLLADGGLSRHAFEQPAQDRVRRLLDRLTKASGAGRAAGGEAPCLPSPALWPSLPRGGVGPSLTLINACGRFTAQAHGLWPVGGRPANHAPTGIQISLRRLEPHRVAVQRVLRELPLTAGQAAVCAALHRGRSHAQIAGELGVAPSTVVDHTRKLLRTLDVADGAALRSLIDRRVVSAAR